MSDPLNHIARPALPWQTFVLTECGRPVEEFADGIVVSRVETKAIIGRLGKTGAYMVMCVTCLNRANYDVDAWDLDPVSVMRRHCERGTRRPDDPIATELRAIALLVQAHRDEFDQTIRDLADAVPLSERRQQRAKRR